MKAEASSLANVRDLLNLSLYLYRRAFGILIGYSAWLLLPIAASFLVVVTLADTTIGDVLLIILNVATFVLAVWVSITLTIVSADLLFKDPIQPDVIATKTRARFFPVILVVLLVGIIQLVGFLLFIIPGIILAVWYGFAQAETILNEKTWLTALASSRELSRGRFGDVLWRFFGGELMLVAVYVAFSLLLESLLTLLGVGALGIEVLLNALSVIYLPLFILYSTSLYLELKRVKRAEEKKEAKEGHA